MTRERAKKIGLYFINRWAKENGWNSVYMAAPKTGKNTWTAEEYEEALINDTTLEGTDENPIDEILNLEKFYNKRGKSLENEKDIKNIK